ncbi:MULTISPECIES: hypothetical protein [unclassified Nocardia]|uniref:hypothetical protein n=1 Tax=unclassified Nocardia TaxID=2637762 RepID=UPI0024A905C5|nr:MULTISPECIES: hypothetical protein [unclassified Nocardia]
MIPTTGTPGPTRTIDPAVYDQTVERLSAELAGVVSRQRVELVLRWSLDDLTGNPPGAMPELGERLARQRLLEPALHSERR